MFIRLTPAIRALRCVLPLTCAVFGSSACASNDDGTAHAEAWLEPGESVWSPESDFLDVLSVGGGFAGPGAECLPGFAEYTLEFSRGRLSALLCGTSTAVGTFRYSRRVARPTPEQWDAVRGAAARVTLSSEDRCEEGKPYVALTVGAAPTTGTRPSYFAEDSRCGDSVTFPGSKAVANVGGLLEVLRSIPLQEPPPAGVPARDGSPVWTDDSRSIYATQWGHGFSPAGSLCMFNQRTYNFTMADGSLVWTTCEAVVPSGQRRPIGHRRVVGDGERAAILRAAQGLTLSPRTTCGTIKALQQVNIYGDTTSGAYEDDTYACIQGPQHVTNTDALFEAFEAAAHP